jgi:regulator of protease activity HflC (stomatin/prohibitin superfamily)
VSGTVDRLVEFFISIIKIFQFWEVMEEPEYGVIFRLGSPHRDITPSNGWRRTGFHPRWPLYLEQARSAQTWTEAMGSHILSVVTADGVRVSVRGVMWYKVVPEKVRTYLIDLGDEGKAIRLALEAAISTVVEKSTFKELIDFTEARQEQVLELCRKKLNRFGLKLFSFEFTDKTDSRPIRLIH